MPAGGATARPWTSCSRSYKETRNGATARRAGNWSPFSRSRQPTPTWVLSTVGSRRQPCTKIAFVEISVVHALLAASVLLIGAAVLMGLRVLRRIAAAEKALRESEERLGHAVSQCL